MLRDRSDLHAWTASVDPAMCTDYSLGFYRCIVGQQRIVLIALSISVFLDFRRKSSR